MGGTGPWYLTWGAAILVMGSDYDGGGVDEEVGAIIWREEWDDYDGDRVDEEVRAMIWREEWDDDDDDDDDDDVQ